MIKFLSLDFFSVSHRMALKYKNAIYCLQISALVQEVFKFEICVKYADEITDDVIYSAQYYVKYLQHRPLKLCRLIVVQATHLCQ